MRGLSPRASLRRQALVIQSRESRNLRDRRVRDILIFPRFTRKRGGRWIVEKRWLCPPGRCQLHLGAPGFIYWLSGANTHRPDNGPATPHGPRINVIRCDG